MQNTQNLKFVDPQVIKKNWYLARGLNLFNVTKNNAENLAKKPICYTLRYGLNVPFVKAVQGFINQFNYQGDASYLRHFGVLNNMADARMLHPDILYLNRRVQEAEPGRLGFQEIIIDRKKRRVDAHFRVWGMREIFEREFLEEGTHTVYGFDKEALADAPEDCLRPNMAYKILQTEEEVEEAKTMVEKMLKKSEDGLCRLFDEGTVKMLIPIPQIKENFPCVQYGCQVYVNRQNSFDRTQFMNVVANNLYQQAIGIVTKEQPQEESSEQQ